MCNGYNHFPDCTCGFGGGHGSGTPKNKPRRPRKDCWFEAKIQERKIIPWTERLVRNERNVIQSMREEGMTEEEIAQALKEYRNAQLPLDSRTWKQMDEKSKKDIIRTMKRILGFRERRVEKTETITKYIPLFVFSAPPVTNSQVIYQEESETREGLNWLITVSVPGMGFGTSREFGVKGSCTFRCKEGESKMIYIPVTFRVSRIGIYQKGKRVRDGKLRIAVQKNRYSIIERTPKNCNIKQFKKYPQPVRKFLLASIDASEIPEYGETWSKSNLVSFPVEVSAFGFKVVLNASIYLKKQLTLTYRLPGGRNYYLHHLLNANGIAWKVSGGRKQAVAG